MLSQSQSQRKSVSGSLFGNFWRGSNGGETIESEAASRGLSEYSNALKVVGVEDKYSELVALGNAGQIFRDRLVAVLQEVAFGAMEQGAREIYIGHPREYRYEFFVDERGFQGAIRPSDYSGMLKLFCDEAEIEIAVDWPDVEVLQLSLTNNSLNPVIHVSWRYRWVTPFVEDHFTDQVI